MLVPKSVSPVLTFGGFLASCSSVLRRMDQAKEVESRIMIQVRAPTGVGHPLRLLRRVRPTTRHQAAAFLLGEAGARNLEMEHRPNCRPNAEQPLAAVSPPPVASLLGVRPTCLWASQYPSEPYSHGVRRAILLGRGLYGGRSALCDVPKSTTRSDACAFATLAPAPTFAP